MPKPDTRARRLSVDEDFFSDFPINLDRNPVTGNLALVTNEEAVKSSLRNIMLTQMGEWPRQPLLGSKIYRSLFEPTSRITASVLKTAIEQAAVREPRAQIVNVSVTPDPQENGYTVTIQFYTVRSSQLQVLTHFLRRVR